MRLYRFRILPLLVIIFLFSFTCLYPARLSAKEAFSSVPELSETDEKGGKLYKNDQSQYGIYTLDEEDLLTDEEEEALLEEMAPVTEYGYAAFVTTSIMESDYMEASRNMLHSLFGEGTSSVLFLIDMNHRQLVVFSDGEINKTITKNYANSITDNVYRMAHDGKYYDCAVEVFRQIHTLLSGRAIAQPMKHITNAFLAIILSAMILYIAARINTGKQVAKSAEILALIGAMAAFSNAKTTYNHRSKSYNPRSRSSGGGSFGGGGSSGSGGSHGF